MEPRILEYVRTAQRQDPRREVTLWQIAKAHGFTRADRISDEGLSLLSGMIQRGRLELGRQGGVRLPGWSGG